MPFTSHAPRVLLLCAFGCLPLLGCKGRPEPTALATGSAQLRTTAAEQDEGNASVTIAIDGMSCSACAARLKRGLKALDGVIDAEVSLEQKNARVRYLTAKTDPDKLVAAIRGMGFETGTPAKP